MPTKPQIKGHWNDSWVVCGVAAVFAKGNVSKWVGFFVAGVFGIFLWLVCYVFK
jgi:hypothetical protein